LNKSAPETKRLFFYEISFFLIFSPSFPKRFRPARERPGGSVFLSTSAVSPVDDRARTARRGIIFILFLFLSAAAFRFLIYKSCLSISPAVLYTKL
jgi:hypothetical protein